MDKKWKDYSKKGQGEQKYRNGHYKTSRKGQNQRIVWGQICGSLECQAKDIDLKLLKIS